MEKECEHKWVRLYYRETGSKKNYGKWTIVKDTFICNKCRLIKQLN